MRTGRVSQCSIIHPALAGGGSGQKARSYWKHHFQPWCQLGSVSTCHPSLDPLLWGGEERSCTHHLSQHAPAPRLDIAATFIHKPSEINTLCASVKAPSTGSSCLCLASTLPPSLRRHSHLGPAASLPTTLQIFMCVCVPVHRAGPPRLPAPGPPPAEWWPGTVSKGSALSPWNTLRPNPHPPPLHLPSSRIPLPGAGKP